MFYSTLTKPISVDWGYFSDRNVIPMYGFGCRFTLAMATHTVTVTESFMQRAAEAHAGQQ